MFSTMFDINLITNLEKIELFKILMMFITLPNIADLYQIFTSLMGRDEVNNQIEMDVKKLVLPSI